MPHATPARIRTAADRQKLLDLPLTPLWGEAGKVPADAFIVGKVKASQDLRRVTVSLGAFDRQSLFDILEFEAQTDRYVLADIGQGFSLAKRRVRGVSDDAILSGVGADIDATEGAKDHDRSPQTTGFPVELTVYYDQQPQPLSDDPAADGSFNYSLPEPQPGQSLTFGLRNVTDQPVGVVLLVNGVSTLYEQEGEPADLTKWMLEPRKEYRVKAITSKITKSTSRSPRSRRKNRGGSLTTWAGRNSRA